MWGVSIMNKEEYVTPEMEIIEFEHEDVISESNYEEGESVFKPKGWVE